MSYKELKSREDFERYYREKREGILMLKNYLEREKLREEKMLPTKKSYLEPFLKDNKLI